MKKLLRYQQPFLRYLIHLWIVCVTAPGLSGSAHFYEKTSQVTTKTHGKKINALSQAVLEILTTPTDPCMAAPGSDRLIRPTLNFDRTWAENNITKKSTRYPFMSYLDDGQHKNKHRTGI